MFDSMDNIIGKTVVISNGTKEVPISAYSNSNINTLVLPEGLERIGAYAFANNNIKNLIIPSSVKELGMDAFVLNKIETITFNEGLEEIPSEAFYKNNINNLVLPNSLKRIGKNAFANNNLKRVVIPNNVYEIEKGAFDNIDIEYRGILITKEEISKYGCENIISLMHQKKSKLIKDNTSLSNEKSNLATPVNEVKKDEKEDKEYVQGPLSLAENSDELVKKIIELSLYKEKECEYELLDLKVNLRNLSSELKCKNDSMKNLNRYKKEVLDTKNYISGLTGNELSDLDNDKKNEVLSSILRLADAEINSYDLRINNLNKDIEVLCMKIRNIQSEIRKLETFKAPISSTKEYLSKSKH